MREIRFRAWHKEAEQYCEGSTSNMFQWLQDGQPVILEQYTGLKDCEGTEIYEGDLIQLLKPKSKDFATVDFINAYVGGWVLTHKDTDNVLSLGARNQNELKVIGNIHQNPELIK